MSVLKRLLNEKILILDGAMGSNIQKYGLCETDYRNAALINHNVDIKGNNDILSITRPDVIKEIHKSFLEAGADIIETNTFGANSIVQREYGLEHLVKEMNINAVKLAKAAAREYSSPGRPRFAAGSIGPAGKTASIPSDAENPAYRNITFDELENAYYEQASALITFGADILLIETIFDTLNAKAAVYAVKKAMKEQKKDIPLMLSVTMTDKSGRTLSGQTLDAFYYTMEYASPVSIGINCALGINEMKPYIRELSNIAECAVSVYANAGLPDAFGNYNDTPEIMAAGYKELAEEGCINIAGGCCGAEPKHIKAIAEALRDAEPRVFGKKRTRRTVFTGLETLERNNDSNNLILIGERANVTGSLKFAKLIEEHDLETAVKIAGEQLKSGADIIDICMDKEFLNSKKAMTEFLNYAASSPDTAKAPFMIDSSDFEVIKSGLKCVQGKSIVNSISLKHGGKIFLEQAEEINNYGAAIAAAAFDEEGQASDTKRRVSICRRAYKLLKSINIPDENIIFDLNIFPLASGIKEHDMSAVSFIESCRIIKSEMPGVLILGGISNLSFSFRGLKQTRAALNSIFLHYAAAAGLDTAIVNANQLVKYEDIEEPLKSLCEAVIFNTSEDAGEKLLEYSLKMEQKNNAASVQPRTDSRQKLSVEERLQNALIKGTSEFLEEDIKEALKIYTPLEIIEKPLLTGMNKIGELFADGRMFLPQIIKSAHIMKQASGIVKRYMPDAAAEKPAGIIVLASVKGDVHDIGKNILSLVLSCSGFKTVDLGVMVSCSAILEAAREQNADIIGLSGLIMPSLNEMIYNAEQLDKSGLNLPALMIGGAASSALHTALKIAPEYRGITVYIKSASEAASIAHKIIKKDAEFINALKSEQQRLREEYEKKHN